MRLMRPRWVSHGGEPLYTVDIHPDGSRVATAGFGTRTLGVCSLGSCHGTPIDPLGCTVVDTKIRIWNMAPIRDPKAEADSSVHRKLCVLTNHLSMSWSLGLSLVAREAHACCDGHSCPVLM